MQPISSEAAVAKAATTTTAKTDGGTCSGTGVVDTTNGGTDGGGTGTITGTGTGTTTAKARAFYGSVEINPSTAKMKLVQVAEKIINLLASDPTVTLKITVTAGFDNLGQPLRRWIFRVTLLATHL